jgi:hypothetical protein
MTLVNDYPARFSVAATVCLNLEGQLTVEPARNWQPVPGSQSTDWTAILDDAGAYHYFHLIELLIWLCHIQHHSYASVAPKKIIFTHQWINAKQNSVQLDIMRALYPQSVCLDPNSSWPMNVENVTIIRREWARTTLNKFNEACVPKAQQDVMFLGECARRHVVSNVTSRRTLKLLYVVRPPPRRLEPNLEEQTLSLLSEYGEVSVVDFSRLPWEQQVRHVAAADVLAGVHGNGLTNALWMRPDCTLLEFFPPNVHHYDYQFIAELAGLHYFGLESDNVFTAYCRVGSPYGHTPASHAVVDRLNFQNLRLVLDIISVSHRKKSAFR